MPLIEAPRTTRFQSMGTAKRFPLIGSRANAYSLLRRLDGDKSPSALIRPLRFAFASASWSCTVLHPGRILFLQDVYWVWPVGALRVVGMRCARNPFAQGLSRSQVT